MLIVPREVAAQLAASKGIKDEIAVLSQCNEYVDGEPSRCGENRRPSN